MGIRKMLAVFASGAHLASAEATTLLKMMIDAETPASTKVRAAECFLAQAVKAIEIEEIEARLTAQAGGG
jgi:hypothetical protein